MQMHKNKSVNVHQFAMVPKQDIPRSAFVQEKTHKTTFDAGYLIPIYLCEVLPGDSMSLSMTAFTRLATPLYPVMDNLHLDSFFFFVPYRLLWTNWKKFMGEQDNPADSISYTIPQMVSKASGYDIGGLHDYMGLPTLGQVTAAATVSHSSLPLRAYNAVWNAWFRDENLQNSVTADVGDGPDTYSNYALLRRGKRPDYFTTSLPSPQKGSTAVSLPLGTSAPITTSLTRQVTGAQTAMTMADTATGNYTATNDNVSIFGGTGAAYRTAAAGGAVTSALYPSNLIADLSTATAATINQLRSSIAIQQLLEKDARGGTRYVEIILSQFGVRSPDYRLQRPEYLGGGSSPIVINPIAQTSGTSASGTTTPLGNLAAMGTGLAQQHGFSQAFTEHGIILGLVQVRADLTYQQGLEKFWKRSTRYDFYTPIFANLGEQAVYNREIYCKGDSVADDALVFGYQERAAEYRYSPSMITSLFRSTAASTIDGWHLAQKFTSLPTLNSTFIQDTPPVSRIVAVGASANGQQFIFDSFFRNKMARAMPMYGIPGLKSL
ncbi:MAG: major capsid protein [Microvirus sp.]|nr:MAG: major capsid protein [Microvirus sp.]